MQRKVNMLLLAFGLLGAAVGAVIGEALRLVLPESWPSYVTVGLYFGQLALWIGVGCLIAELIAPRLNGHSWRQRYTDLSWKLLLPATLVLLFVVGAALQFVFGLDFGGTKRVKDIVLVIDNSGSMSETDPDGERYAAAKGLIAEMNKDKRVALISFTDSAQLLQPFANVGTEERKEAVYSVMDGIVPTDEGTNFSQALGEAVRVIESKDDQRRGTMVILLSDGFSDSSIAEQLNQLQSRGIAVHTIGLKVGHSGGIALLKEIAESTGGHYYDVSQSDGLSAAFQNIYMTIDNRMLNAITAGAPEEHDIYKVLRILSYVIIGAAIGLSLGLLFDNRYLALSFGLGGVAGGSLAGLIMHAGLSGGAIQDALTRSAAAIAMTAVIALFTLVVPIGEKGKPGRKRADALAHVDGGSRGGKRNGRSHGF
ncbi:VWA domain-containing protein [Paenibacillus sp. J5C_2022]|uniref:vWA domain-containing protein n=1 Tax=Paenibacillus sp. J5C2022 TaxID=2977129 RepID=UPI0021D29B3B|nr:vWA domain-containing protein [Paenibacillus sp. J5C2022]MCU6710014.1 VWA domain-containing protein [Paenibacillus sp. J5C2022]